MIKAMKIGYKILAFLPLVFFMFLMIMSLGNIETMIYIMIGALMYLLIGIGLISSIKEYKIAGFLSLMILVVLFYFGDAMISDSAYFIYYIVIYYGLVFGLGILIRHLDAKKQ